MDVALTPDQEALVRQAIKTGRIERAEDVVTEALLLWEERELLRAEFAASLDQARASLMRGEGRLITRDSMQTLAEEAKQRLRARLAVEPSSAG
jgi:Arc/MetJ-type ribon-helix-helix transcriptional regulator